MPSSGSPSTAIAKSPLAGCNTQSGPWPVALAYCLGRGVFGVSGVETGHWQRESNVIENNTQLLSCTEMFNFHFKFLNVVI